MFFLRYQIFFTYISIFCLIILFFILSFFIQLSFQINMVVLIALAIAFAIIRIHIYDTLKEMDKILNTNCDPETYEIKSKQILASPFITRYTRVSLSSFRIVALSDMGNHQQAYDAIMSVNYISKDVRFKSFDYLRNLFLIKCNLHLNRVKEANEIIDKIERLIKQNQDKSIKAYAVSVLEAANAMIFYHNREFDKCEKYFNTQYSMKKNTIRNQVVFAYALGTICLEKTPERAKVLFNYVVENGNKLYVASEAQEQLKLLSL